MFFTNHGGYWTKRAGFLNQAGSAWIAGLGIMALLASGCGSSSSEPLPAAGIQAGTTVDSPASSAEQGSSDSIQQTVYPSPASPPRIKVNHYPLVLIETSMGDITVKLNAEKAPVTVDNFLENYVERGFYEQTIFHHVEQGFMIAGGGYTSDQQAKEAGAYILNEADNGLKNRRGTLAMARHAGFLNSATSQFFFNLADNPSLDHQDSQSDELYGYCVFGEVVAGMDVIDRIAQSPVTQSEEFPMVPVDPVTILSVRRLE